MIQSRATDKGLSVAVEAESISVSYVKADMGKLRQILINLLNNAVQFSEEGEVTIRCGNDQIPEEPNRCYIVIEVEDTGLWLSICKKYAELMGGTIELESKMGKGSLFRLRLPAEIAEEADAITPVDDKPTVIGLAPTQKTWRVLVADDNRENLLLLKSLLEEVGFVVLEAKNGREAVAAFKRNRPIWSGWTCACRSWTVTRPFGRSGGAPGGIRFRSLRSRPKHCC